MIWKEAMMVQVVFLYFQTAVTGYTKSVIGYKFEILILFLKCCNCNQLPKTYNRLPKTYNRLQPQNIQNILFQLQLYTVTPIW